MSKRIHPHEIGNGGVPNPAYNAFREEERIPDDQKGLDTANKQPKLQEIIDLQLKANAARKDWKDYITRKRNRLSSKKSSEIHFNGFQKRASIPDNEFGLEMDPDLPKTHPPVKVTDTQATQTVSKNEQHKLNMKLIEHFVSLNQSSHNDTEVDLEHLQFLLDRGANINCQDRYGQTVLHETARLWHTDVAIFLIERGADVKKSDRYGRTPLHVAAATDYAEMIELLLERGAELEAVTAGENQTALHFAARNDAVEACKILVRWDAQIEVEDYKKRTPVHIAAELDRSETARWLVENGANVGISDDSGQSCMTHMITKMGPVAKDALDTFHKTDRTNRRQYFYLNLLEHDISADTADGKKGIHGTMAKTPLQVIVSYKQLDIIMHPVILKMLQLKWLNFGRMGAVRLLLVNLIYILLWTSLAVGVPWQERHRYDLPGTDVWRIVVWILAIGMTAYFIGIEISEIMISRRRFHEWKSWKIDNIQKDMQFCHPKWPEERDYLHREIENLDEMLPAYFQDFWNFFDWTVYFLNFAVLVTHAVNIVAYSDDNRPPPCCISSDCETTAALIRSNNVTERGSCTLPNAFVNNASLSAWVNRVFAINIIMMWLRLMKSIRSFRTLGPFVVMLGKIFYDIVRFLFLYFEFYIPYACAFWMIFGGEPSIQSMSTVDQLLFSLYRITLVDDYQYDEMHAFDIVMTYLLVGTFLGISAILCINLFIALLSDTFQRVYDNANANAVMQQAIQILSIEENLNPRQKQKFRRFINRKCSPREEFYDDDLTTTEDDSLKKATLQIRDQMDEVLEYIRAEQREKKDMGEEQFNNLSSQNVVQSRDMKRLSPTHASLTLLSSNLIPAITAMNKRQNTGERMLKRMHRDVKEIKSTLTEMFPDFARTSLREGRLARNAPTISPASLFEPATFPLEVKDLTPTRQIYTNEDAMRRLVRSFDEVQQSSVNSFGSHRNGLHFELTRLPGSSDVTERQDESRESPERRLTVVAEDDEAIPRAPNV